MATNAPQQNNGGKKGKKGPGFIRPRLSFINMAGMALLIFLIITALYS